MPSTGDTIDRYVIEAVLGEGGMGRVYRALDPRLGRRVALKVMLAEGASEEARGEAAARLEREARAAAAFNHPNVVAIYDVGEFEGSPYIAMELVSGSTLRTLMQPGRSTEAQRLTWLLEVARGLGVAHRAGLVHRDIKPDNVMITPEGVVKVLDFGIARWSDAGEGVDPGAATVTPNAPSITAKGVTIGTPQYMAPEQIRGEPLDGRADQFAWGVMAFEVLAGKLPWAGGPSAMALFASVLTDAAPSVRELVPALDPRVDEAIRRALEKKRELRFGSMEELVAAIEGKDAGGARLSAPLPAQPDAVDTEELALAATTAQPAVAQAPAKVSPRAVTVEPPQGRTTGAAVVATQGEVPAVPTGRRWRLPWRAAGAVMAIAALGAGGLALYRSAHRSVVHYCAFVEAHVDGPRCVVELDAETAGRRLGSTHRFTEVGGRVVHLEEVTFAGRRVEHLERTDVVRNEDGTVRELIVRDHHDNVVRWEKWSEGGKRVDLVDEDGKTPRRLRGTTITTIRRELDASGRIAHERFFAATGRPARDEQDAYGYAYLFGRTAGTPIRQTVLGADGKPAAGLRGESVTETVDDGTPGGADVRFFDLDGKPVTIDGVYREHRTWSEAHEQIAVTELGLQDQPAVSLDSGVHEQRLQWDPGKRTLTEAYFDEAGRPRPRKASSHSAVRLTYDERGRVVLQEFLDAQGNAVYPKNGAAALRFGWDEHDDQTSIENLDVTGALMQGEFGFARQVEVHDGHGWLLEQRHYDENGKLALWREGGAIQRYSWDPRGLMVVATNLDAEEHPVANAQAWSTTRARYARLRDLTELSYFGPDGHPCVHSDGYAIRRETYDDDGDVLTRAYFDTTGAPAMFRGEYATERMTRDPLGYVGEEEYLDTHGERVLRKDGYAAARFVRDRNGDVIQASYLGRHDEPIVREGGYAKKTMRYDVHRRLVETMLFDPSGVPADGAAGWTIERDVYDDRGLLVRRDHLDAARHPVLTRSGSASTTRSYDARGNVVEETSLGVQDTPVVTPAGHATKKNEYDERDELVRESLLGADGKPVSGAGGWSVRQLRYDEMGNLVEEAFFDGEHRAVTVKGVAYASVVSRFDARRRLVETAYFDASGAPANGPEGVAAVRYRRDGYGRAVETAYVDGAGAPQESIEGKQVVRTRYDDAGRALEELFVDGAGAPRLARDGCAGHRSKYDGLGRRVEESCVDVQGQLGTSSEGWSMRRTLHDARANAVDVATYGPDGKLRPDRDGIARRRHRFDERNLLQETTFFDASDRPTHDARGGYTVRFEYDERGKRIGMTELDEKGRPLPTTRH